MNDSTNNINIEELVKKYESVLEIFKDREEVHRNNLAIILEICINYIKQAFQNIDIDEKILTLFVVKELYFKNKITNDSEMVNTINDFIAHYDKHFMEYRNKYKNVDDLHAIRVTFGKDFVKDKTFVMPPA
jgi:hypothetical protein